MTPLDATSPDGALHGSRHRSLAAPGRGAALAAPLLFETALPAPRAEAVARERLGERWEQLRTSVALAADEPCLVALSGGADSVLLLLLAASGGARLLAVHVDHGLRGGESDGDAAFCARLCSRLAVPFVRRRVDLPAEGPSLEARAREARYRALSQEARRAGIRVLLTGHHADDAIETLLLRWLRGSEPAGLAGLRARTDLPLELDSARREERELAALALVRPLLALRRAEVRAQLAALGETWREDSSNASRLHARNRVRHDLLPWLEQHGGPGALASLRSFERSVQALEEDLAARTAHLSWSPPPHGRALRAASSAYLGGMLERSALCGLSVPLRRRALFRLLCEGTGQPPSRQTLDELARDLASGRCTRRTLPGGWSIQLRSAHVHLEPPASALPVSPLGSERRAQERQLELPGLGPGDDTVDPGLRLPWGGAVSLPDGRELRAERSLASPGAPVPRSEVVVELDARDLPPEGFTVRWARPGDRFQGLGSSGSRRLGRFLADCGVPRGERRRVPLVFARGELVWVAGIRPCERHRVRADTTVRLRLELR